MFIVLAGCNNQLRKYWNNKEIADATGTSEGTVKNHVSSILAKLGVRDRTRAVLKAMQLGYL